MGTLRISVFFKVCPVIPICMQGWEPLGYGIYRALRNDSPGYEVLLGAKRLLWWVQETESMTALVQVDSGAEFGGEVGCASMEGMTVLLGDCRPLEFPLYTCQCVFLFWEPRRNVVWEDRQIYKWKKEGCSLPTKHMVNGKCWLPLGMPKSREARTVRLSQVLARYLLIHCLQPVSSLARPGFAPAGFFSHGSTSSFSCIRQLGLHVQSRCLGGQIREGTQLALEEDVP